MPTPFANTPLSGLIGVSTASFFRLDKSGNPVQLITDINPLPTKDRVVLDMIDSESNVEDYDVTENALQDLSSATTNVHRKLERMEITGTLVSSINLGLIGAIGLGNIPGQSSFLRSDLQILNFLKEMGRRREPIMAVTPRNSMQRAFINRIVDNWTPELGENTSVQISLVEARIVSPLTANSVIQDIANSFTGNNSLAPNGGQSGTPIDTQNVTAPAAFGAAPTVVAT